jgi:hypothetical protein
MGKNQVSIRNLVSKVKNFKVRSENFGLRQDDYTFNRHRMEIGLVIPVSRQLPVNKDRKFSLSDRSFSHKNLIILKIFLTKFYLFFFIVNCKWAVSSVGRAADS